MRRSGRCSQSLSAEMRLGAHQCTLPTAARFPTGQFSPGSITDLCFFPSLSFYVCPLLFPLLKLHRALVIPGILSLTSQSKTAALVRRFFTGRKDQLPTAGTPDPLWSSRVPTSEATLVHALLSVSLTGWVRETTTYGTPRLTLLDHRPEEPHARATPASPSLTLGANQHPPSLFSQTVLYPPGGCGAL